MCFIKVGFEYSEIDYDVFEGSDVGRLDGESNCGVTGRWIYRVDRANVVTYGDGTYRAIARLQT